MTLIEFSRRIWVTKSSSNLHSSFNPLFDASYKIHVKKNKCQSTSFKRTLASLSSCLLHNCYENGHYKNSITLLNNHERNDYYNNRERTHSKYYSPSLSLRNSQISIGSIMPIHTTTTTFSRGRGGVTAINENRPHQRDRRHRSIPENESKNNKDRKGFKRRREDGYSKSMRINHEEKAILQQLDQVKGLDTLLLMQDMREYGAYEYATAVSKAWARINTNEIGKQEEVTLSSKNNVTPNTRKGRASEKKNLHISNYSWSRPHVIDEEIAKKIQLSFFHLLEATQYHFQAGNFKRQSAVITLLRLHKFNFNNHRSYYKTIEKYSADNNNINNLVEEEIGNMNMNNKNSRMTSHEKDQQNKLAIGSNDVNHHTIGKLSDLYPLPTTIKDYLRQRHAQAQLANDVDFFPGKHEYGIENHPYRKIKDVRKADYEKAKRHKLEYSNQMVHVNYSFYSALLYGISNCLHEYSARDLANAIYVLYSLNYKFDHRLCEINKQVNETAFENINNSNNKHDANGMKQISDYVENSNQNWAIINHEMFLYNFMSHVHDKIHEFNSQDIANTIYALCKIDNTYDPYFS